MHVRQARLFTVDHARSSDAVVVSEREGLLSCGVQELFEVTGKSSFRLAVLFQLFTINRYVRKTPSILRLRLVDICCVMNCI